MHEIPVGPVHAGSIEPGQTVKVFPSGQTAVVSQVLSATRQPQNKAAGHSAGIVLDREVDVSRGDWLLAEKSASLGSPEGQRQLSTTVAWMDDEPLVAGRLYWALHGHRWVKVKVQRVVHRLNVNTLAEEEATELAPNAIGHVTLALPRHGKLTQACRVVGDAIEALTQAWGQQLSPGPLSTSGLLGG